MVVNVWRAGGALLAAKRQTLRPLTCCWRRRLPTRRTRSRRSSISVFRILGFYFEVFGQRGEFYHSMAFSHRFWSMVAMTAALLHALKLRFVWVASESWASG